MMPAPPHAVGTNVVPSKGVFILSVKENSLAHSAGLAIGDILLKFGGQEVNTPADVQTAVMSARGTVQMEIIRANEPKTLVADFGN